MNDVAGSLCFASGGDFILTDDKAPVELLGIQVIDGLIQTEAAYYKKILQENGIRGLANSCSDRKDCGKRGGDDCGAGKEKDSSAGRRGKCQQRDFLHAGKKKDMRWFPVKVWHRRAGRLTFFDPQLMICDITLPDGSGLEAVRYARERSSVHIICLTALDGEIDQVMGYESGADDYVTKPFSLSVLTLKIRAFFSRQEGNFADIAEYGKLKIDLTSMKIWNGRMKFL